MIGKGRQWRGGQRLRLIRYDSTWQQYYVELSEDFENRFKLSSDRIYHSLNDYLSNVPTKNWHTRMQYISENEYNAHLWGIQVYNKLIENLYYAYKLQNPWYRGCMNNFYTIYAHKFLMYHRIKRMKEIHNYEFHVDRMYNYMKKAQLLINLHIKNSLSSMSEEGLKKMTGIIKDIRENEKKFYESIMEDLKIIL